MVADTNQDLTSILKRWNDGDELAPGELMEALYDHLRRIARQRLRAERAGHTLEPTALVNELYMTLSAQRRMSWQNRNHFLAVSSQLMRRLLAEYARNRNAQKRRRIQVTLSDAHAVGDGIDVDVLTLHATLEKMEELHPREARVVELRYFGGMTFDEIATEVGVSEATAKRDWRFARSWLLAELRDPAS